MSIVHGDAMIDDRGAGEDEIDLCLDQWSPSAVEDTSSDFKEDGKKPFIDNRHGLCLNGVDKAKLERLKEAHAVHRKVMTS
jgi:hypothetical protein